MTAIVACAPPAKGTAVISNLDALMMDCMLKEDTVPTPAEA
jgi:hypothetical protein